MNSHTNFRAAEGNAITRLLINRNGLIVGEERDPETKKASLFAVNLTRDSSLWSNVTIDEPWWFGLIDLTDEAVYLQRYAEGPLPTAAGVTAIDLSSGRVLWSLPRVAYHQEAAGEVILLQQGILQQQYFAVDSRTGEHIRKINVEDLPPRTETDLRHLTFPSVIAPDETSATETLSEASSILRDVIHLSELRGSIEYLRRRDHVLLAYYLRDTNDAQSMLENKLRHEILIFDREANIVVFREQIGSSLNYPIQGSYFLYHDQLLYVKASNELRSISLG